MRLTVLVDNIASSELNAEWGLSFYLEEAGFKILFDLGASDLFLRNGQSLGMDLLDPDYLILSHGHWDHTWGLEHFIKARSKAGPAERLPILLAHPSALVPKLHDDSTELGILAAEPTLARHFTIRPAKEPVWLSEKLVFLGQIPRHFPFENTEPLGKTFRDGSLIDDFVPDDTALAYRTSWGLVIITGCSHAGICNIIKHAREVCGEPRVADVIGGFHLLKLTPDSPQLQETLAFFRELQPAQLHACHCTDLASKIALAQIADLQEVKVGLTIEY